MAKKDFSQVETGRVYDAIAEATAEAAEPAAEQDAQEVKPKKRGPRKTYTEEEKRELIENMTTAGRKGVKMPRVNLQLTGTDSRSNVALTGSNYEYVQIMSRVCGMNLTQFINKALNEHRQDHIDLYEKALEFRRALDNIDI